jgi:hypothetical protein
MKAPALVPIVTLALTLLPGLAGRAEAKGVPGGGDIHASPAVGIANSDTLSLNLTSTVPATNAQGQPNGPCDVTVKFLDAGGQDAARIVTLAPQQSVPVGFTPAVNAPFGLVRVVVGAPPTGQGNAACKKNRLKGCVQVLDSNSNETKAIFDAF